VTPERLRPGKDSCTRPDEPRRRDRPVRADDQDALIVTQVRAVSSSGGGSLHLLTHGPCSSKALAVEPLGVA